MLVKYSVFLVSRFMMDTVYVYHLLRWTTSLNGKVKNNIALIKNVFSDSCQPQMLLIHLT